MVYGGKPSTGCQRCKKRRIKCDEKKPDCSQCMRLMQKCPGYKNLFDLMHRDETRSTEERAERAAGRKKAAAGASQPGGPEIHHKPGTQDRPAKKRRVDLNGENGMAAGQPPVADGTGAASGPGPTLHPQPYQNLPPFVPAPRAPFGIGRGAAPGSGSSHHSSLGAECCTTHPHLLLAPPSSLPSSTVPSSVSSRSSTPRSGTTGGLLPIAMLMNPSDPEESRDFKSERSRETLISPNSELFPARLPPMAHPQLPSLVGSWNGPYMMPSSTMVQVKVEHDDDRRLTANNHTIEPGHRPAPRSWQEETRRKSTLAHLLHPASPLKAVQQTNMDGVLKSGLTSAPQSPRPFPNAAYRKPWYKDSSEASLIEDSWTEGSPRFSQTSSLGASALGSDATPRLSTVAIRQKTGGL